MTMVRGQVLCIVGSGESVPAIFIQTGTKTDIEKRKVGPFSRQHFVVRDLNVFRKDLELLIADECLINQIDQHRIIEEFCNGELRRVFQRGPAAEAFWQTWARLCVAQTRNSAGRQKQK